MSDCICNVTLSNLGRPSCPSIFKQVRGFVIAPLFDSLGAINKILLTLLTPAGLKSRFQAADPLDRFFPFMGVKNLEGGREDSEVEEFTDGTISKERDGVRAHTLLIDKANSQWIGKLRAWACTQFGVYIVDKAFNIRYHKISSDPLNAYPIPLDANAWDVVEQWSIDGSGNQKAVIAFQFDNTVNDKDIYFAATDLTLMDIYSLVDIIYNDQISTNPNPTLATELVVNLVTCFGEPATGFTSTDVELFNFTTQLVVAISAMVETVGTPGEYTITHLAQTTSDVGLLRAATSGTELVTERFDFNGLASTTFDFL